jgi:hypothetical protein
VIVRRTDVEGFCFVVLLVSCLLAFLAWLVGMVRPKGFGAGPAALWIGLLLIALLCSGTIGFIEFVR